MPVGVIPHFRANGEYSDLITVAIWHEDSHRKPSDIAVVHEAISSSQLPELAEAESGDVRCGIPLSLPPRLRRSFLRAVSTPPSVEITTVIDAPLAIGANLLKPEPTGHAAPSGDQARAGGPFRSWLDVIVTGASNGSVSILVADRSSQQMVSIGSVTTPREVRPQITRLRPSRIDPADDLDVHPHASWAEVAPMVRRVVGYELSSPQKYMLREIFGPQILLLSRQSTAKAVLEGLSKLERLAAWTAPWPTARVHLGSGWTRQPGPLRSDAEEHLTRIPAGVALRFSESTGRPLILRAGSIQAAGCAVPDRLGTHPRLRLIDDGRLVLFGPPGTPPLAAHLSWPIPGSGNQQIGVRSASTAGVELLDAEPVREVHTTAAASSPGA